MFKLYSKFEPSGDQPQAIYELVKGIENGVKEQVLLGATGTGKTFTIANVINKVNKPTLVLAHNKTLAGQLYSELKAAALAEGATPETQKLVKDTLSKLKYKNAAQLLGYIYSGVVLGIGIPKLNIAITKYCENKKTAKQNLNTRTDTDKMKLNSEFMQKHANTKTFGAFYNTL